MARSTDNSTCLPLYEQSSQFRDWSFTEESLLQTRQELNQQAIQRVGQKLQEEHSENVEQGNEQPSVDQITYLSVEDELSLVGFYLTKVPQLAKAFNFSEAVASTAMSFLKRFYLKNTCMDYHPKNVMLTCLFLASKTENQVISISHFATKIKQTTPSGILSLEFLVSQSLRFQFKVHHAFVALYGLYLDLQLSNEEALGELETAYNKACMLVQQSRLTDLEFLYTPSQIALAAFYVAEPTMATGWLFSKQSAHSQGVTHDDVLATVKKIAVKLEKASKTAINLDTVRQVDKRLKYCRNPEKDPNSSLFKKRAAEAETDATERQAKKAKLETLDDPFSMPSNAAPLPESAKIKVHDASSQSKGGPSALHAVATPPESKDDVRLAK